MKQKRSFQFAFLALLLCAVLTGCTFHTSRSYTFSIDNGDSVKITLNTTDGYSLSSDVPFEISYQDNVCSLGTFLQIEGYDYYVQTATQDPKSEILGNGKKDGNDYFFWTFNNQEFNYVVKVNNSSTAVLIGNNQSKESAEECFDRLTIELQN